MVDPEENDRSPILQSPKAKKTVCQECGYVPEDVTDAREHRKGQPEHWFDFASEEE